MTIQKLAALYRYPVKGLYPESLNEASLKVGLGVEGDRAFAFQFMDDAEPAELRMLPAESAPWIFKSHLLVQHDWPDLSRVQGFWDAKTHCLRLAIRDTLAHPLSPQSALKEISECVDDSHGRARLAAFMNEFLKDKIPFSLARHPANSPLRLVGSSTLSTLYTDSLKGPVSIGLRESIRDLETSYGFSVDERRFRLNFYLEGAPAWSELDWKGRTLRIGKCLLKVIKPIGRCPNIDVDPESGERLNEIFPTLRQKYGHSFTGIRADVIKGGLIKAADDWELLTEQQVD